MKRYTKKFNEDVGEIILQQLGGRKFTAITGAKNLMKDTNWLSFKIPKAKSGINYVKIILNSMDLYDIEFGRLRGTSYKIVNIEQGVYIEDLQRIFTDNTGLYTRL